MSKFESVNTIKKFKTVGTAPLLNTYMSNCPKIGDNEKNNGTGSHTIPLLTPLLHRNSTVARRVTNVTSENYGDP